MNVHQRITGCHGDRWGYRERLQSQFIHSWPGGAYLIILASVLGFGCATPPVPQRLPEASPAPVEAGAFLDQVRVARDDAVRVIEAFGPSPERGEAYLRILGGGQTDSLPSLVSELAKLRDMTVDLDGWLSRVQGDVVTPEEQVAITSSYLDPLESGLPRVIDLLAAYLVTIPPGSGSDKPSVAIQGFYELKDHLLIEVEAGWHATAEGRELVAPMISDLMLSPGLRHGAEARLAGEAQ